MIAVTLSMTTTDRRQRSAVAALFSGQFCSVLRCQNCGAAAEVFGVSSRDARDANSSPWQNTVPGVPSHRASKMMLVWSQLRWTPHLLVGWLFTCPKQGLVSLNYLMANSFVGLLLYKSCRSLIRFFHSLPTFDLIFIVMYTRIQAHHPSGLLRLYKSLLWSL